ncbi:MAG: rhodanese-like domain-containing protein [bacterium]
MPKRFCVHPTGSVSLLEPEDLQARLHNDDTDKLLLVQVSSADSFLQAHIPGAVLVTPASLVCGIPPATGKLPSLDHLNQLFGGLGYSPELDIVIYDDEGGGWAGRFAWTLDVIGHTSWQYLNGGLHAWHGAGLALAQGPDSPRPATQPDLSIDSTPIAEVADVLATIDDPDQVVWDVRSADEYAGRRQVSARVGHVPGAINIDWLLLQDPARQYRFVQDIADTLEASGISQAKTIITHCQTHHRSGLSYMLGRLLGLPIKAYHGSWSEWGNLPDTPIEVST